MTTIDLRTGADKIAQKTKAPGRLDPVLALHTAERRWQINTLPEISFDSFSEAEDSSDGSESEITYFEVCAECKRIEESPCEGGCVFEVGYESALWPCRTVRAIEEATG